MQRLGMDAFEAVVSDALDGLPPALAEHMDNVVVCIEESHPEGGLLGLYQGIPLTEREAYGMMELPDTITVYRDPLCDMASDADDLRRQVRVTVVHEVAHHFGFDDEQLEELGWA